MARQKNKINKTTGEKRLNLVLVPTKSRQKSKKTQIIA
jgi:hypothetical protein